MGGSSRIASFSVGAEQRWSCGARLPAISHRVHPEPLSRVWTISDAIVIYGAKEQLTDAAELFDIKLLNYIVRCTDLLRRELYGCRWELDYAPPSRPD